MGWKLDVGCRMLFSAVKGQAPERPKTGRKGFLLGIPALKDHAGARLNVQTGADGSSTLRRPVERTVLASMGYRGSYTGHEVVLSPPYCEDIATL